MSDVKNKIHVARHIDLPQDPANMVPKRGVDEWTTSARWRWPAEKTRHCPDTAPFESLSRCEDFPLVILCTSKTNPDIVHCRGKQLFPALFRLVKTSSRHRLSKSRRCCLLFFGPVVLKENHHMRRAYISTSLRVKLLPRSALSRSAIQLDSPSRGELPLRLAWVKKQATAGGR